MNLSVEHHIVGVDGGGTGCRAAVSLPDGTILGRASAGAANVSTDVDQAIENVRQVIVEAGASADLGEDALRAGVAHIGLAGVMSASDSARVAGGLPIARCVVTDDRVTSVAGALGAHDGALLGIGTGTIIAARHGGTLRFIGGWGLQVSDQASGGWLGRALLEQVLLCHDGMKDHSELTKATLNTFEDGANGIVAFANSARPADYATFAPRIIEAAHSGDANGRALLLRGAEFLNHALDLLGLDGADVLCLTGGVGPHYAEYLRPAFRARIRPAEGNALDGALGLARQAAERGVK